MPSVYEVMRVFGQIVNVNRRRKCSSFSRTRASCPPCHRYSALLPLLSLAFLLDILSHDLSHSLCSRFLSLFCALTRPSAARQPSDTGPPAAAPAAPAGLPPAARCHFLYAAISLFMIASLCSKYIIEVSLFLRLML